MTNATVLVIGSNATRIELQGGGSAEIGQYLNETVVPAMALLEAGYDIVLATPDGTKPHIDEASDTADHFGGDAASYQRARSFYADHPSMNQVRTLASVLRDGLDGYAGVFVPGGHAPAVDLMQDADVGEILRRFHDAGKPTALLCHGPIALLAALPNARAFRAALIQEDREAATDAARDWPYAGYAMTVFSASEERVAEEHLLKGRLHFNMPEALELAGGKVNVVATDFAPNVVVDRELITGQNPASDHQIAAQLIEALGGRRAAA
ncbi:type 1 glutamine amidotransferase domain-containing protein [Hansschlegelia beijingensis]|uniref:Putative intracellular protease/amidase n=1 Tax=Hansschlegelia beijingensis TaxID=1133344 RepID=A0A7W6D278_9HYPH|nr:type 1 glutamine amidotransferase domain-containing protein [Hansschlegelia beijingensis]MBB3971848.1 putative intracellular protease/amidase [Hansschlegelia beijingensis]